LYTFFSFWAKNRGIVPYPNFWICFETASLCLPVLKKPELELPQKVFLSCRFSYLLLSRRKIICKAADGYPELVGSLQETAPGVEK
jgi:hypothetical protein